MWDKISDFRLLHCKNCVYNNLFYYLKQYNVHVFFFLQVTCNSSPQKALHTYKCMIFDTVQRRNECYFIDYVHLITQMSAPSLNTTKCVSKWLIAKAEDVDGGSNYNTSLLPFLHTIVQNHNVVHYIVAFTLFSLWKKRQLAVLQAPHITKKTCR